MATFRIFSGFFFLLLALSNGVQSASILAVFSSLSFVDHMVFRGYISLLVQSGHSVVMMTPFPGQLPFPENEKVAELDVSQESGQFWDEYMALMTDTDDYYPRLKEINELSLKVAIAQIKSMAMQSLLKNPSINFDLVITEADVPMLYAIADKYNAPHISISASSGKLHQHEAKGSPTHPLIYPDTNTLYFGNMSIWQKLTELRRYYWTRNEYYSNYLPLNQISAEKLLGLKRPLIEVEKDIAKLLLSTNPILSGHRPTVPGVSYCDRLNIKPGYALPANLQSVLDSSTKGAIYFSIGGIQESENLSPLLLKTISETFSELPYTVLWKIGNISMITKPNNVVVDSWFPQQEVLAHPNIKAFITHGGIKSLEEAVFYEVPIVGLPTVKSKKVFIDAVTKHGAGILLDPHYLDKETFKSAILAVASDKKYKEAITLLKYVTINPTVSGPEHAVLSTEQVLRTGISGGKITKSPFSNYTLTQYYMLDVLAFLIVIILALLIAIYYSIRYSFKKLRLKFSRRPISGGKFKAL